jgi:hypothetical protein
LFLWFDASAISLELSSRGGRKSKEIEMTRLTFSVKEVAPLVAEALAAKNHRCSYGDLYEPAYHKGGAVKLDEHGFPDPDNIDQDKVPPMLWLVYDQGIYLMPNTPFAEGQQTANLAYAAECNPRKMEFDTWRDAKQELVGGDDGVESLPVEMIRQTLLKAEAAGKKKFCLELTEEHIRTLV